MFETYYTPRITPHAVAAPNIDRNYYQCWVGLKSHFDASWTPEKAAAAEAAARSKAAAAGDRAAARSTAAAAAVAGGGEPAADVDSNAQLQAA